jgi:hypothetical protein
MARTPNSSKRFGCWEGKDMGPRVEAVKQASRNRRTLFIVRSLARFGAFLSENAEPLSASVRQHWISQPTPQPSPPSAMDPAQVGGVFSWRLESMSGDAATSVTVNEAGEADGRGRSIRVR